LHERDLQCPLINALSGVENIALLMAEPTPTTTPIYTKTQTKIQRRKSGWLKPYGPYALHVLVLYFHTNNYNVQNFASGLKYRQCSHLQIYKYYLTPVVHFCSVVFFSLSVLNFSIELWYICNRKNLWFNVFSQNLQKPCSYSNNKALCRYNGNRGIFRFMHHKG